MKKRNLSTDSLIGVGLRIPHHSQLLSQHPPIGWLEVHSENYFADARLRNELTEFAQHYPISLHGVGLSLGSTDPLDRGHLKRLASLIDAINPILVSEHLSWSSIDGAFLNDLLPLPYTPETFRHFADRVDAVQQVIGRQLLIENPSSYLQFTASTMDEWTFFGTLPEATGCGLLLDLNNLYVVSQNQGFEPALYLRDIPFDAVQEIHLAGHDRQPCQGGGTLLVDTHSGPVSDPVWALYRSVLSHHGPRRTLIEWDTRLPDTPEPLLREAERARTILAEVSPGRHP
ncbi:hypothetical protein MSNKSG1_15507 [Marinobacter santoriniensis NKSG1]|uniref:Uncharacterized protein n=1 Tax=Marinobacter santoriniensis NKSG1 TaxID=1288826 RepID=M7CNH9_9GAMM|nr:DUF692 domain-containing protein [Marinobacter santoriniensis]EMP54729.1 hypothetical protein MSNKSG1_15507 [Marinobacter santoriniensis NKSG1]